jgi:hypothetical protein
MNEFLKFKKAFNNFMTQPLIQNATSYTKWIKVFSAGVIMYSGYYYLKRKSMQNSTLYSFSSYYYHIKKLFSESKYRVCNGSSEKETQKSNISLEVKELPEHVKYDGGWYNELDDLKQLNSQNSTVVKYGDANFIRESTPRGEIIMYYDSETKSFHYYSNSKNIPYSTLDAVARKYVCLNKDPSIYVDIRDEVQKGRERCLKRESKIEKHKSESGIISSAKKSLFAAFKNYKTGRNAVKSLFNEKKEIVVIKDNINKFVYKGTLEQYDADLKHRKHCEHIKIKAMEAVDCDEGDREDVKKKVEDHLKLHHEKQDLSYSEFKQKYNY